MIKTIILLGAWLLLFPLNIVLVTVAMMVEYVIAIFNMPTDLWEDLNEQQDDIHIEEDEQ